MNEETIYPPCKKCGAKHGMGVEEMATGKIEPIDLCYACLWSGLKFNPIETQIKLSDGFESMQKRLKEMEERILAGYDLD